MGVDNALCARVRHAAAFVAWAAGSARPAPRAVVEVAQRAAAIVGDGLYGVDLKQTPTGEILVIEVNDNPSIDAGVEDDVLGDALYEKIVESLVARVERRRRIVRVPS